jgi:hypothetical protein
VGAVYVKVIVFPVEPAETLVVVVVNVPAPSVVTRIDGEAVRLVSVPPEVDCSWPCQVWAPVDDGAVAPGPDDALLPYTIVDVEPPDRVMPDTVMVWDETDTVPVDEVV